MDEAWFFNSAGLLLIIYLEKAWVAMGQVYTEEYSVICL